MGDAILSIFKFVLAVILFPIVAGCLLGFYEHMSHYSTNAQNFLQYGALSFICVYLFLYQFEAVHEFGQQTVRRLFAFMSPLTNLVANVLPFYTILIMLVFWAVKSFGSGGANEHYFVFFSSFTLTMHILLVSHDLRDHERSPLKPKYFLTIASVFIVNTFLYVALMDLVRGEWTIPQFYLSVVEHSKDMYGSVFGRFFGK